MICVYGLIKHVTRRVLRNFPAIESGNQPECDAQHQVTEQARSGNAGDIGRCGAPGLSAYNNPAGKARKRQAVQHAGNMQYR